MRDTASSGGQLDWFGDRQGRDRAELVDRAAHKLPGSDGKVGLNGCSYLGIDQCFTAAAAGRHSALKVIAPDQRGYTRHARPRSRRAYRRDGLVEDVVALVDAAGVDRVHLVGHDWGGGLRGWLPPPDRIACIPSPSFPCRIRVRWWARC